MTSLSAFRFLALLTLLGASTTFAAVTQTSKAGLAWPNGDTVSMGQFAGTGKVSWYYTWISGPINYDAGLEFVPMLWGDEASIKTWDKDLKKVLKNKPDTTAVMGMNEPDHEGQAHLTPEQGAKVWQDHLEPLRAEGIRLGSPGTTSAGYGKQWHLDWNTACAGGCNYDFLVVHHYGTNATDFMSYVTDMYETFKKPVWVTEWADNDFSGHNRIATAAEIADYLKVTQDWMDSTTWIERYAWFGAMKNTRNVNPDNGMLDQNGAINALGLQYINWTAPGVPDSSLPKGANKPGRNSSSSSRPISALLLALSVMMMYVQLLT
ncbi:glycosyl hydrolase catalytic core-domain-containing protein [Ephemerocybe angulata]|uniref:Glycosyl hydrolase catalytic core-domain-containing protein n=1 Tax=Ephemerocybe angulata TaxID=980116 RepID=A0A8H6MF01_9AGAR|nr:glycosyl hydrolase catalytic core-domain-containing protein [Tulosesus angulatus]